MRGEETSTIAFDKVQYTRKFLILGSILLPCFSLFYNPGNFGVGLFDVRMIAGIVCLLLYISSWKSKFAKNHLFEILQIIAILVIPYMNYVLYSYKFESIWVVFHFLMFTALSSLYFRKLRYLIFVFYYLICFAFAFFATEIPADEKRLLAFLMIAFIIVNYVLFNSFLMSVNSLEISSRRLVEQNKAFKKYAFLNAHKIRGPLARILGLIYLQKLEGINTKEFSLLDRAAEELDHEIKKAQKKLNIEPEENRDHIFVSSSKKRNSMEIEYEESSSSQESE